MNLPIYQKKPHGNIQVIEQTTDGSGREVHLKFTWDPQNPTHNHYYTILLFDKSGQLLDHDRPSPNRQQMTIQHDYQAIDLAVHSYTTPMQQHLYFAHNKNDMPFSTHLFINIAPESVDDLPEDLECMKIFKIKCLPREWVERIHDLRYFRMHSSGRKGLVGTRKVGKSLGNLYSPYDECPFKLSAGGEKNTSNFQNVEGPKICISCRHHVNRQWCRAQKMTEA